MNTRKLAAIAVLSAFLNGTVQAAVASEWDRKLLFGPSSALLEREEAGNVTIYDGVLISDVDRAMDEQFDRVESMMFVRTLYPAEEGAYEAEDDCD